MSASTTSAPSATSVYASGAFWEGLWRVGGFVCVASFVIAAVLNGYQPRVGAPADVLANYYTGNRTRILFGAFFSANAVLFLLWFAAALRTSLADAGRDGWGAAATASSAVVGALTLLLTTIGAALAYSIAGSGNAMVTSGLNDFAWACTVLTSPARAMLIMAGSFGLWRARVISNALFAVGVAAMVLVLLGAMTWMSDGFWAPDGAYSRFVAPIIGLAWITGASVVLLTRTPRTRAGW